MTTSMQNLTRVFRANRTILVVLGFLIVWELAGRILEPPSYLLPLPSSILQELAKRPQLYLYNGLYTALNTIAAFVLATVLGIALAVAIVHSKFLENTLFTLLVALNSVPKVALAPLFVLWFGTGRLPDRDLPRGGRCGARAAVGASGNAGSGPRSEGQQADGADQDPNAELTAEYFCRYEGRGVTVAGRCDRGRICRRKAGPGLCDSDLARDLRHDIGVRGDLHARVDGNGVVCGGNARTTSGAVACFASQPEARQPLRMGRR
jgi:hypothetical protein